MTQAMLAGVMLVGRMSILHTGVCEINTHPTCGQCRTPPIPPNVNVHGHARGECNRSVK